MRLTRNIFFAAIAFLFLKADSCDNHLIEDNGFELWCGEQLCHWELESGGLRQVPTWHDEDIGVELVGNDVAISQVSNKTVSCIQFDLVTDIETDAVVTLEIDYYVDGSIDEEITIPTARWAPVQYKITAPARYQGVLFRLRKRGNGRARLAQIEAIQGEGCPDKQVVIDSLPLGAVCSDRVQCDSGLCAGSNLGRPVCSECETSADCGGDLCGYAETAPPYRDVHRTCVAAGSRSIGALCVAGEECESGSCADRLCSACESAADCGDAACAAHAEVGGPRVCEPGAGVAPAGALCILDSDCQSGDCDSGAVLKMCELDGRPCEDESDCPGDLTRCVTIGEKDGTCK